MLVFGLTAHPLCESSGGEIRLRGAAHYEKSRDGLVHTLELGSCAWPDGSPITPEDYLRGMAAAVAACPGAWFVFFQTLQGWARWARERRGRAAHPSLPEGIRAEGRRLHFRLTSPNEFLPAMLSAVHMSPLHPVHPEITPGAYRRARRADQSLSFLLNSSFAEGPWNIAEKIDFHVIDDPVDNIRRYEEGLLDQTCDTMFPYTWASANRDRTDACWLTSRLLAVIRVCRTVHPALRAAESRRGLLHAIDRAAMAAALSGLPRPLAGLDEDCPEYGDQMYDPATAAQLLAPARGATPIRFGYNRFFPNRQIAEHVAAAWEIHGVNVQLMEEEYGAGDSTADLKLEIRAPHFDSPYAFFALEMMAALLVANRPLWRAYTAVLREYQAAGGSPHLSRRLNSLLLESAHQIPLVRLPRFCLVRPGFSPVDLHRPAPHARPSVSSLLDRLS